MQPEDNEKRLDTILSPTPVLAAWDITTRKQAERIIRAQTGPFSFSCSHTIDEVLTKTLNELCDILSSPIGFFYSASADEKTLILKAFSAAAREYPCKIEETEMRQQCAAGADVWSECLRKRRPAIRNSASFHRKNLPGGPAGTFRELAVPVMRRGKVVAILGVGNKPFDYTDKDLKIVSYFADIAWLMVEHQQSEEIIRYISFHDMLPLNSKPTKKSIQISKSCMYRAFFI